MLIDEIETAIATAIEKCEDGTADPQERSIAAAAMIRVAYAYAEMDPQSFAEWLGRIAADFRTFEVPGSVH
jgi:hypothetical protein